MKRNKKEFLVLGFVLLLTTISAFGSNLDSDSKNTTEKANNISADTVSSHEKKDADVTKTMPNIKDIIPLEDKSVQSVEGSYRANHQAGKDIDFNNLQTANNNQNDTIPLQKEYNLGEKELSQTQNDDSTDEVSAPPSLSEATIYDDSHSLSDFPKDRNNRNNTQVNRYATVENKATKGQINPLNAVAQFRFLSNVKTIGDAINHVLQNTSYQLVPESKLSILAKETMAKPLPITDRTLGPIAIKDAVLVLIGQEVFNLQIDLPHRLINFKTKSQFASTRSNA